MKFFIGNNLLTSKEIKETKTGGIQMYLIGNMYAGKKGEEILEKVSFSQHLPIQPLRKRLVRGIIMTSTQLP